MGHVGLAAYRGGRVSPVACDGPRRATDAVVVRQSVAHGAADFAIASNIRAAWSSCSPGGGKAASPLSPPGPRSSEGLYRNHVRLLTSVGATIPRPRLTCILLGCANPPAPRRPALSPAALPVPGRRRDLGVRLCLDARLCAPTKVKGHRISSLLGFPAVRAQDASYRSNPGRWVCELTSSPRWGWPWPDRRSSAGARALRRRDSRNTPTMSSLATRPAPSARAERCRLRPVRLQGKRPPPRLRAAKLPASSRRFAHRRTQLVAIILPATLTGDTTADPTTDGD